MLGRVVLVVFFLLSLTSTASPAPDNSEFEDSRPSLRNGNSSSIYKFLNYSQSHFKNSGKNTSRGIADFDDMVRGPSGDGGNFQNSENNIQAASYFNEIVGASNNESDVEDLARLGNQLAGQLAKGERSSLSSTTGSLMSAVKAMVNLSLSASNAKGLNATCASLKALSNMTGAIGNLLSANLQNSQGVPSSLMQNLIPLARNVGKCAGKAIACGQTPVLLNGDAINQTVGNVRAAGNVNMGIFSAAGLTPVIGGNASACIQFHQTDFKISKSGLGKYARDLSLLNGTNYLDVNSSTGARFNFTLDVDDDTHASFVAGRTNLSCAYLVVSDPTSPDLSAASVSSSGVYTGAYNQATRQLNCTSTHLTTFVVSAFSGSLSSPSPTPNPKSAMTLKHECFGTVLGLGLAAALYCGGGTLFSNA